MNGMKLECLSEEKNVIKNQKWRNPCIWRGSESSKRTTWNDKIELYRQIKINSDEQIDISSFLLCYNDFKLSYLWQAE